MHPATGTELHARSVRTDVQQIESAVRTEIRIDYPACGGLLAILALFDFEWSGLSHLLLKLRFGLFIFHFRHIVL